MLVHILSVEVKKFKSGDEMLQVSMWSPDSNKFIQRWVSKDRFKDMDIDAVVDLSDQPSLDVEFDCDGKLIKAVVA